MRRPFSRAIINVESRNMHSKELSLRPATALDERFLLAVYVETRRGELTPLGWRDEQITIFCRMQFDLQSRAYRMQFPEAVGYVVEHKGEAIGRLLVNRVEREIRLIDIAFLPQYRNLGAGTILIENLQVEAQLADKPLELRVLTTNAAAIRLYARLGFVTAENNQTHLTMRWRARASENHRPNEHENDRRKDERK